MVNNPFNIKDIFMKKYLQPYEEGLSGKVGDEVYYNRYGKTLLRRRPGSYNRIPTEKQAAVRLRFAAAHLFAQSIIADPVMKVLYTKKAGGRCTAYSMAVSEYLRSIDNG